jgi:hypothetical protein
MVGKGDHFIWFLSDRNYPQVWGTRPTTETGLQVTLRCRAKGKSCETIFDSRNQRRACRRSLSHTSGMHYGSRRVSTDAQSTALQRAVLPYAGCTTRCMDAGLAGATVPRPPRLGGVTRGAGVTHLRRGERARARGTHAVCRWSGVLGRDSAIPRTGDAAVAGPRSPVPLPQGSPAGTACAPLACSKEIVLRERHGTRPTRLCQHHFYGVISPRRLHWDMRRNAAIVPVGRRAMPPYCPAGDGLWFQEPCRG